METQISKPRKISEWVLIGLVGAMVIMILFDNQDLNYKNKNIMETQISKPRKIAAWVLIGLVGAMVIMSATLKLMHAEELVTNFTRWGLVDNLTFIGAGELIFIILFIIPRTSSLGFLLLTAHFGGAIATHLQHQESFVMPAIILTVIWIGNYLRNPEMLASFTKK